MKKRILASAITILLSISCMACGSAKESNEQSETVAQTETVAQNETNEKKIIDGIKILNEYSIQVDNETIKHIVIAENTNSTARNIIAHCTAFDSNDVELSSVDDEQKSVSANSKVCFDFSFKNLNAAKYDTFFLCSDPTGDVETADVTLVAEKSKEDDYKVNVFITNNSDKIIDSITFSLLFFKNNGLSCYSYGVEQKIDPGSTIECNYSALSRNDQETVTAHEFDFCEVYADYITTPFLQ